MPEGPPEPPKSWWESIKQGASDLYNKVPTPDVAKAAIQERVEPDLKPDVQAATRVEKDIEPMAVPSAAEKPRLPNPSASEEPPHEAEGPPPPKEDKPEVKAPAEKSPGANEPSGQPGGNPPSREIQRHSTSHNPDQRSRTPNDAGGGKRADPDGIGLCSITA